VDHAIGACCTEADRNSADPKRCNAPQLALALLNRLSLESLMKKMKLVMVGNGMAGVRTLEELLKIAPDHYDITVFGAEPHPNYNRILLSPVLAGEQTLDEIVLNPISWYEENGIHLQLGKKVVEIDRRHRVVRLKTGPRRSTTACSSPPDRPLSSCPSQARTSKA